MAKLTLYLAKAFVEREDYWDDLAVYPVTALDPRNAADYVYTEVTTLYPDHGIRIEVWEVMPRTAGIHGEGETTIYTFHTVDDVEVETEEDRQRAEAYEPRCAQCEDPFRSDGPGQRSLSDPTLCEYCYTNSEDDADD